MRCGAEALLPASNGSWRDSGAASPRGLLLSTSSYSREIRSRTPEAYPTFLDAIAPSEVPVAFVPGNHDHRAGFSKYLSPLQGGVPKPDHAARTSEAGGALRLGATDDGALYRSLYVGHVRILLLDSLWDGHVEGRIGPRQLAWIDRALQEAHAGPTVVFVHHPPIPTGVDWLDPHVIEDGDELTQLLVSRGAPHISFGHVHQPMTLRRGELVAVSGPATSFAFGGDGTAPIILDDPPAVRWIEIDGPNVRSRVESVGSE
ncbi:MAG: metallophosphoesterase [Candidatus Eisenbacteria bacterium]